MVNNSPHTTIKLPKNQFNQLEVERKNKLLEPEKRAQRFRALVVFAEELGLVSNTHMEADNLV